MPLPFIPLITVGTVIGTTLYAAYKGYQAKDKVEQLRNDTQRLVEDIGHKLGGAYGELKSCSASLDEAKLHLKELCSIVSEQLALEDDNAKQDGLIDETISSFKYNFSLNNSFTSTEESFWEKIAKYLYDGLFKPRFTLFPPFFGISSETEKDLERAQDLYDKIEKLFVKASKISDAANARCADINKYTVLINRTEDTLGQLWDLYDSKRDFSVRPAINALLRYNTVLMLMVKKEPLLVSKDDPKNPELNVNPKFTRFMENLELGLDQIDFLLSGCGIKPRHNSSSSSLPASAFKPPVSPLLFPAASTLAVKH